MAIQVSGTTVINNSRQLQNIATLDSTTTSTIKSATVATTYKHEFTTTSTATVDPNGGFGTILYKTGSFNAGTYTFDLNNVQTFSGSTSSRFTRNLYGTQYNGAHLGFYAYIGTSYYALTAFTTIQAGTSVDLLGSNICNSVNGVTAVHSFTTTSSFEVRVVLGTYPGDGSTTPDLVNAVTEWGGAGGYTVNTGFQGGFRIAEVAYQTVTGSGTIYP